MFETFHSNSWSGFWLYQNRGKVTFRKTTPLFFNVEYKTSLKTEKAQIQNKYKKIEVLVCSQGHWILKVEYRYILPSVASLLKFNLYQNTFQKDKTAGVNVVMTYLRLYVLYSSTVLFYLYYIFYKKTLGTYTSLHRKHDL